MRVTPMPLGCSSSGTQEQSTTTASAGLAIGRQPRTCFRLSSWRHGAAATSTCRTTKFLPWLYGIATNVVRNRQRSERRFAAALRRVPEHQLEPNFTERSDERLDDEQRMLGALDLLAQLPAREQEVFALCAWMELTYEDAALALGVPGGTIRSRLSRARKRIRELVAASGHEEDRTATVKEAGQP